MNRDPQSWKPYTRTFFETIKLTEKYRYAVMISNPPMRIRGKKYRNKLNDPEFSKYVAFLGIPYATPPLGPLRFQPPEPLPWSSIEAAPRIMYEKPPPFPQRSDFENNNPEDCLYLNIYLPKKPKAMLKNTPVLVYILSGGFQNDNHDSQIVKPDIIIRQNLVFVTINYRQNLFGFLNTRTEVCSGNAGLKDQVQALKWIRMNIDKFGGDQKNVTITGHGAGATWVNLHMISPLSKGLFHQAIVQGGGIYSPWGYPVDEKRVSILFPKKFNSENELAHALSISLLRERTSDLLGVTDKISKNGIKLMPKKLKIFYGPSIEIIKKDAFIPWEVEHMMKKAKPIPLMAGVAEQEGYEYILDTRNPHKNAYDDVVRDDDKFTAFLMQHLRWTYEKARRYNGTVRAHYFPRNSYKRIEDHFAAFMTDIWFSRFYHNFKIGGRTMPFYVYRFSYLPVIHRTRLTKCGKSLLHILAATHGDDVDYLYNPHLLTKLYKEDDIRTETEAVINQMCHLWGNFCRTGIPANQYEKVKWFAHTERQPCYLNIDASFELKKQSLHSSTWHFLNAIIEKERTVCEQVHPNADPDDSTDGDSWFSVNSHTTSQQCRHRESIPILYKSLSASSISGISSSSLERVSNNSTTIRWRKSTVIPSVSCNASPTATPRGASSTQPIDFFAFQSSSVDNDFSEPNIGVRSMGQPMNRSSTPTYEWMAEPPEASSSLRVPPIQPYLVKSDIEAWLMNEHMKR